LAVSSERRDFSRGIHYDGRVKNLSWQGFAAVAGICLVLSTQVLFQPGILEDWPLANVARGWLDYFAEILLCGMAMWVAVELVGFLRGNRLAHSSAVLAALIAGALLGSGTAVLLLQPPGFYPPLSSLAGDALRWAIFGFLVFLAHEHLLRETRATAALEAAAIERASLDKQMLEAQLEVLQAQIEPHFLFNTLAHVKRLYEVRRETGDEMLTSLRHYLRAALPRMRAAGSTLQREAELVQAYLSILRLRLGPRLEFSFDIPPAAQRHALPPMVLITLVENAIKHGIAPRPEGGAIHIRAAVHGRDLEVEVADTGAGFSASLGNGVGLANIRARLKGLHGRRAALTLRHNSPNGVVACVRVPAESAAEAVG
jgi:signal transduction histidine kinase